MAIAKQGGFGAIRSMNGEQQVMAFLKAIGRLAAEIGTVIRPSYQPERHYMRGPGPACARREQQAPQQ